MTQKISEEKVFDLVRPLYQHKLNRFGIPIMNKVTEDRLDFSKVQPLNVQNLSIKNNNTRKLVLGFSHDDKIARFYNNPRKYVPLFQSAYAVATPDYSLHPQMYVVSYLNQIYKNRWLGCFWQEHGIMALPCVRWTTEEWDDLRNHKQAVSIDLQHAHHGVQPHKHLYLDHSEKGIPISEKEQALVNEIKERFGLQ